MNDSVRTRYLQGRNRIATRLPSVGRKVTASSRLEKDSFEISYDTLADILHQAVS